MLVQANISVRVVFQVQQVLYEQKCEWPTEFEYLSSILDNKIHVFLVCFCEFKGTLIEDCLAGCLMPCFLLQMKKELDHQRVPDPLQRN